MPGIRRINIAGTNFGFPDPADRQVYRDSMSLVRALIRHPFAEAYRFLHISIVNLVRREFRFPRPRNWWGIRRPTPQGAKARGDFAI